jgi:hypothetical protein
MIDKEEKNSCSDKITSLLKKIKNGISEAFNEVNIEIKASCKREF